MQGQRIITARSHDLNIEEQIEAAMAFVDELCHCGEHKKSRYSFCSNCYGSLPDDMRSALYQRIGEGYEGAYREACLRLDAERIS